MIELNLTNTQARRLLKCLDGASACDKVLAEIYEALDRDLSVLDSIPQAPWRKVVGKDRSGLHGVEVLECGHRRMLRYSKNWVEDWGVRRRCEACLRQATKSAAA
jgi:hypothetical protein